MHARIGGHRVHRHVEVAVERGDAGFVVGRSARGLAVAFREDDDLAAVRDPLACVGQQLLESSRVAFTVDDDHPALERVPAVEGDDHQLLLHHEAGVGQDAEWDDRVEHALMLWGDQRRAGRNVLLPADLHLDVANRR